MPVALACVCALLACALRASPILKLQQEKKKERKREREKKEKVQARAGRRS